MAHNSHLNAHGLGERIKSLRSEINLLHGHPESLPLRTSLDQLQEFVAQTEQLSHFKCFIVDFLGVGGVEVINVEDVAELASGKNPAQKLPTLYSAVESWINEMAVRVTDKGYGTASWHLGVHCTPGEAWWLVKAANKQFEKACKAGLLQVQIQPWAMEYDA